LRGKITRKGHVLVRAAEKEKTSFNGGKIYKKEISVATTPVNIYQSEERRLFELGKRSRTQMGRVKFR